MNKVLLFATIFLMTSSVSATIISADADGYGEGTNISTAFAGMTLSSVGSSAGLDGYVYAYEDSLASTGTSVFGHNLVNHKEWYFDFYPELHQTDDYGLRIDFDNPANMVEIDMLCNSSYAYAILRAYDSSGLFLYEVETPYLTYGEIFTATISRDSYDIAYVIAGGKFGNEATHVLLDNLSANVIPEPGTVLLLGLGGLALLRKRKR